MRSDAGTRVLVCKKSLVLVTKIGGHRVPKLSKRMFGPYPLPLIIKCNIWYLTAFGNVEKEMEKQVSRTYIVIDDEHDCIRVNEKNAILVQKKKNHFIDCIPKKRHSIYVQSHYLQLEKKIFVISTIKKTSAQILSRSHPNFFKGSWKDIHAEPHYPINERVSSEIHRTLLDRCCFRVQNLKPFPCRYWRPYCNPPCLPELVFASVNNRSIVRGEALD